MEMTLPRATLSLTILFVVISTVDAMVSPPKKNYLAFPRMGRSAIVESKQKRGDNNMPWNMIFPRKRDSLPGNFILPRKRTTTAADIEEEELVLSKDGYLAFPRMGRSHNKVSVEDSVESSCCGIGLKSEFTVSEDGKEELQAVCTASVPVCCSGLREFVDETPDGRVYTMCIPEVRSVYPSTLSKLKSILSQ